MSAEAPANRLGVFSPKVVLGLILVGVFSFSAFDPSKFSDTFRDFAEKSSVKTKETLSKVKEVTEEAGRTVEAPARQIHGRRLPRMRRGARKSATAAPITARFPSTGTGA